MRVFLIVASFTYFLTGSCKVIDNKFLGGTKAQEVELSDEFIKKNSAPFTITGVVLADDILSIFVKYSGGCKKHLWTLKGNTGFKKTDPPKKDLFLDHNNNGDNCRSLISDTLYFNIQKTKFPNKEKNYTTIIQLADYERQIAYEY